MSIEKALSTCMEMLGQRGYTDITLKDNEITAADNSGNRMKCSYIHDKISTQNIRDIINLMDIEQITHIIIIYYDEITTPAKKIIQEHKQNIIEVFNINELQINITKHRLQPKFELIKKDESFIIKRKLGVKFPLMLESGPISRFFYYRKEDMIRITRKDGYINYRIVK